MSVRIHCVHTHDMHRATFERLFSVAAPEALLIQTERPDWLARARATGLDQELADEISGELARAANDVDAILLTCSTLGPIVDVLSQSHPRIVRIDGPLMCAAAEHQGEAALVMCLESTRIPSVALFAAACRNAGHPGRHRIVLCNEASSWFEAGNMERFAQSIANSISGSLAQDGRPDCIVLTQASMAAAEPLLVDIGIPVYSSPRLAVLETLRLAHGPALDDLIGCARYTGPQKSHEDMERAIAEARAERALRGGA
jgi:hypothetical protein